MSAIHPLQSQLSQNDSSLLHLIQPALSRVQTLFLVFRQQALFSLQMHPIQSEALDNQVFHLPFGKSHVPQKYLPR